MVDLLKMGMKEENEHSVEIRKLTPMMTRKSMARIFGKAGGVDKELRSRVGCRMLLRYVG